MPGGCQERWPLHPVASARVATTVTGRRRAQKGAFLKNFSGGPQPSNTPPYLLSSLTTPLVDRSSYYEPAVSRIYPSESARRGNRPVPCRAPRQNP
jgi:hypothetical protein